MLGVSSYGFTVCSMEEVGGRERSGREGGGRVREKLEGGRIGGRESERSGRAEAWEGEIGRRRGGKEGRKYEEKSRDERADRQTDRQGGGVRGCL